METKNPVAAKPTKVFIMKFISNVRFLHLFLVGLLLCISISHCAQAEEDNKEIFKDDFNRTSGSVGDNYGIGLPSGTNFTIINNRAYPETSTAAMPAILYNQLLSGGFKVTVSMQISGAPASPPNPLPFQSGTGFIVGRSTSSSAATGAYVCGYYNGNFILGKKISGTLTTYATLLLNTLNTGNNDKVIMTFDGASIKCEVSGNNNYSVMITDSTFSQGYAGLSGGGGVSPTENYLYFDDFLIEKL